MKYRDGMSADETAMLMAEINALDAAYQAAELHDALRREWLNLTEGTPEAEEDQYDLFRRAALNHRGEP
jgi:hypothetical protein